ncbi:hypothetical protein AB0N16_24075 [Streptomyces sp. NPDC051105]|uniref:hypothetical protein n=1 Tax=Streptomyces sp. NPDC051105 TaxID=3154843 RepID=UPI0034280478
MLPHRAGNRAVAAAVSHADTHHLFCRGHPGRWSACYGSPRTPCTWGPTPVAGGIYQPVEYELSRTLLARPADGGTTVADQLAWRRDRPPDGTPPREEREALLRKWADG